MKRPAPEPDSSSNRSGSAAGYAAASSSGGSAAADTVRAGGIRAFIGAGSSATTAEASATSAEGSTTSDVAAPTCAPAMPVPSAPPNSDSPGPPASASTTSPTPPPARVPLLSSCSVTGPSAEVVIRSSASSPCTSLLCTRVGTQSGSESCPEAGPDLARRLVPPRCSTRVARAVSVVRRMRGYRAASIGNSTKTQRTTRPTHKIEFGTAPAPPSPPDCRPCDRFRDLLIHRRHAADRSRTVSRNNGRGCTAA